MKTLVVYYSGKGSNKYLALRMAKQLDCETLELRPKLRGVVMLATLTGISFGNKRINIDFPAYKSIILCGPLYMGKFASPCIDFLKKNIDKIRSLHIATCCCSTDSKKDDKFGYGNVFTKLKDNFGNVIKSCEAFPIELVLPEELKNDDQANMNTRLNDDNFVGEIVERLKTFIDNLS